ncbi:YceI family protein [Paraflavitalea soli]|uniref:YceI family protein n=1 Tax=Paraflavitalea soli TaxID=2315862 RepID=A0A3B7MM91_9BACT|nr:YceI family protein [Paraflavitalea soli]AXY74857.1 YceI family protein [Paraflavitalea soli]
MKKRLLLIIGMLAGLFLYAQEYIPADNGSSVKFKVKNFGLAVTGTFTGLQGVIVFNATNPPSSNFNVSVDAASIETGINLRNNHLRGEDYFDVKQYPRISFASSRVTAADQTGSFYLVGKLTIRNVTKDIGFPFTATATENGYVFDGNFRVNRHDFKVGGSNTIADSVSIILHVVARKK